MAAVISAERRALLLEILERDGAIRFEDAATVLDVSTMTVRRDLVELEQDGLVRRVRGGAVAPVRARPFAERLGLGTRAKREIARKVVDLVPHSGAIAIDASSTAGTLLSVIPDGYDLVIATNSYENHGVARRIGSAHAILIGGELEEQTDSFVGTLACEAAASLNYDFFFTSASALEPGAGTSEVTLQEAQVKRVFVGASAETVVLADSAKLGGRALARAIQWDDVALLVTDLPPEHPRLDPYRGLVELR